MKKSMFIVALLFAVACLSACDSVKFSRADEWRTDVSVGQGASLRGQGDLEKSKGEAALNFAQAGEIAAQTVRNDADAAVARMVKEQEELQRLAFQREQQTQQLAVQKEHDAQQLKMFGVLTTTAAYGISILVFGLLIIGFYHFGRKSIILNNRLEKQPIQITEAKVITTLLGDGSVAFLNPDFPGWALTKNSKGAFSVQGVPSDVLIAGLEARALADSLQTIFPLRRNQALNAAREFWMMSHPSKEPSLLTEGLYEYQQ